MVKDKGRQLALSLFCKHLNNHTVVDNEVFAQRLLGLCLENFDIFSALMVTGDLSDGNLTVRATCFTNRDTKSHCFRIMRLCSKLVTDHSPVISIQNANIRLNTSFD